MDSQAYRNCSVQFTYESDPSWASKFEGCESPVNRKVEGPPSIFLYRESAASSSELESGRISLQIKFPEEGVFKGTLTYDNKPVHNGKFEIVVLNSNEASAVQKNVATKSSHNYYEGRLLAIGNEVQNKVRKVYLSVTSKQLVVKEYFWKLLPMRLATFRLSPNTKVWEGRVNRLGWNWKEYLCK